MQADCKFEKLNRAHIRADGGQHPCVLTGEQGPLNWWEIVARSSSSELPFKRFYVDALLVETVPQFSDAQEERETMNLAAPKAIDEQFLEPVSTWTTDVVQWGTESLSIEQWFDEGEELEYSDIELFIEEPDRWERAVQWMRSLVDAAGI